MVDIILKLPEVHLKSCVIKEGNSNSTLATIAWLLRVLGGCIVVAIDSEKPLLIIVNSDLFSLACDLRRRPETFSEDATQLTLDKELRSIKEGVRY